MENNHKPSAEAMVNNDPIVIKCNHVIVKDQRFLDWWENHSYLTEKHAWAVYVDLDAAVRRAVEEEQVENARLRAALEKILLSVETYSDPTRIEEWHGEIAKAALNGKEDADE